MNTSQVMKVEAEEHGLRLRLWTDDERGQHLAVSELQVPASVLAVWWVQVRQKQDEAAQQPLPFDV